MAKPFRVMVFSKFSKAPLNNLLKKNNILPVTTKPDVIICYGGDGTFLLAEAKHPGIPKFLVRKSLTCKKCNDMPITKAIPALVQAWKQGLRTTNETKIEATIINKKNKKIISAATNDIIIRNDTQAHALRFDVLVDKKTIIKDAIGDGVVISTPFGSTAYYHSITRETHNSGIGIALNNTVQKYPPLVVDDAATIEVRVNRGTACVSADIAETITRAKTGSKIIIKKAKGRAKIVML